jgi:hypothetical protein
MKRDALFAELMAKQLAAMQSPNAKSAPAPVAAIPDGATPLLAWQLL